MRFLVVVLVAAGALQFAAAAKPESCKVQLKAWDQCGGKSGAKCPGPKCVPTAWPQHCCPTGFKCVRNDDYYFNCQGTMNDWSNNNNQQQQQQQQNNNNQQQQNNNNNQQQQQAQRPVHKPSPAVPAKKAPNGDPAYGDVLGLSFLFYEAQRSGRLGPKNRIAWRGDSGLQDRAPDGRDVTGGWYDAGDNVKFNLPMAWTSAVLAWSVYEFKAGYQAAGQYLTALDNIKWVTDYFIKCVGDGTEIVGQVGNGGQDHGVWGRPEDKTAPNPVYTLTKDRPGSDVVGAMAAALASASAVFEDADPAYSAKLLAAALKAYDFASKHVGSYNNAIPDAANFYRSSNLYDDLAWAAVWLHVRTGKPEYKAAARALYDKHWKTEDGKGVWNNFDWDSNSWGAVVWLSRWFPEDPFFKARMDAFIDDWVKGGQWVKHTPKGLAFSGEWGSLRHVGNALFLMEAYANGLPKPDKALSKKVECFAHGQMDYILGGKTGRSFVVGYGPNPPQQPHHRAASCPPLGEACTWDYFNSREPNPNVLYGALVGGPNANDGYDDNRNNFIQNEVATDYNAGFTGALAGLVKPSVTSAQCK